MEIIDKGEYKVIKASKDKILTKNGAYFREAIMLPNESADNYTEVDEIPVIDNGYDTRVEALIRERYSISEEFAILRQRDSKPDEFQIYFEYAEECKIKAKKNNQ